MAENRRKTPPLRLPTRGPLRALRAAERWYERTKNPLAIWMAWRACRAGGVSPPDWILDYLDRVAGQLSVWEDGTALDAWAAVALELRRPGRQGRSGRGNVFGRFWEDLDRLAIAADVASRMIQDGHKPYLAKEEVAKTRGINKSTVIRAWQKFGDWFDGKA